MRSFGGSRLALSGAGKYRHETHIALPKRGRSFAFTGDGRDGSVPLPVEHLAASERKRRRKFVRSEIDR
jgi:hypothetical protein